MGTRSNIIVYEGGKRLVNVYQQFDGFPEGVGKELAGFLRPIKLVNGLGADTKNVANGVGCLAAQIVAHFKTRPGGCYIVDLEDEQEYVYCVMLRGAVLYVKVFHGDDEIFQGSVPGFLDFCQEAEAKRNVSTISNPF